MIDLSLDGRVAIVTGGSKGIGAAIARTFAEAGASVAIAARGAEALDRMAAEIEAHGGRALPIPTDVTDPDAVQVLVDRTVAEFGRVDILVNNAGAAPFLSSLDQIRLEGFEKYFRLNFFSAVYATRSVIPVLTDNGGGCILNVASVAALSASPGLSYYASAKSALVGLTRTAARELAGSRIRVNAVAPGWIETEMNEAARQSKAFMLTTTRSIPLGRWGRPDEVAAAALFLCSPVASWITGSILLLDGGQMLGSLASP